MTNITCNANTCIHHTAGHCTAKAITLIYREFNIEDDRTTDVIDCISWEYDKGWREKNAANK
jgi:hypothetical protein